MDDILTRVTQSAFNYALKSGVPIVTAYTFKQCSRLLQQAPKSREREQISRLQFRLESKIKIISPAIDMIEVISARGNTSLQSAAALTRDIRLSIQELGVRLNNAVESKEAQDRARLAHGPQHDLSAIVSDMEMLLQQIDDAVPLINLAITASGAAVSSRTPNTISLSRLLQASTFLSSADCQYASSPGDQVQVGPTFTVAAYMMFASHSLRPVNETGVRDTTWKEVMHKAQVKLTRLPIAQLRTPSESQEKQSTKTPSFEASSPAAEYAYQLSIVEDLDDDRVHTFEEGDALPSPFNGVKLAGVRESLPIHEISKIFYADTGKILGMQDDVDEHRPVLLLKRDLNAEPPRRMLAKDRSGLSPVGKADDRTPESKESRLASPWRLPSGLDSEWMAFEVFDSAECDESDTTDDEDDSAVVNNGRSSLLTAFSKLTLPLRSSPASDKASQSINERALVATDGDASGVKTTLSLLEMMIKLAALQQFRQEPHLAIEDELLNLFLQDASTTGHGAEKSRRQRVRRDAAQRVGFDPYDDSPIKVRAIARADHVQLPAPRSPQPKQDAEKLS